MTDFSVSVLMSLYFKEKPQYLREALDSLLQQTDPPQEIVIICEGDLSAELSSILQEYKGKFPPGTFKAIQSKTKGFAQCLNEGLVACSNEWIARFDTDDICLPERIEKQKKHLLANPGVVLSSAPLMEFDESMTTLTGIRMVPLTHEEVYTKGKWKCPFNHPSTIYKKDVALKLGGYPLVKANEDYAFFSKFLAEGYKASNYPEPLVKARTGAGLIARRRGRKYLKGELESLRYMKNIGYLNTYQYSVHVIIKRIIRLLPPLFVKRVYTYLRK
jgi:glycosyltransferase involved in cell wall biosynthesis